MYYTIYRVNKKDIDQTAWMYRLICVFMVEIPSTIFVMMWLNYKCNLSLVRDAERLKGSKILNCVHVRRIFTSWMLDQIN